MAKSKGFLKTERRSASNPLVFLDIGLSGESIGRLAIELFKDVAPKTAENFRQLCTGEAGIGESTGLPLSYKGCPFHRIIKRFMAQGGDFSNKNGTGGESIYGEKFDDENFELIHDRRGLLSMANSGQNTNGSQFFITFCAAKHLNGKHVVFGQVLAGMGLLRQMELLETEGSDKPVREVIILDCGELPADEDITNFTPKIEGTDFPAHPQDVIIPDGESELKLKLGICEALKEQGNSFFKNKQLAEAISSYQGALRYADIDAFELEEFRETEDNEKISHLLTTCHSNCAACFLKTDKPEDALLHCNKAIGALSVGYNIGSDKMQGIHVKALFRRAQAHMAMKHYDEALEDLKLAKEKDPEDQSISREILRAKKGKQMKFEKEKKAYARMFA